MARVIAIANQKGGTGKTTTTINLGAALGEMNKRILLVDLDPQGTLSIGVGLNPDNLDETLYTIMLDPNIKTSQVVLHPKPSLDVVPSNIDLSGAEVELLNEIGRERILKEKLAQVQSDYDFILIDCPPSLGLLTINALTAADEVLIPVQCQYYALRVMQLLLRTVEKVRARSNPTLRILGLLPTMYDMRTTHSKEVLAELKERYNNLVIDIPIKVRVALADAPVGGQTILEFDPKSESSMAYRKVAEEAINRA